MINTCICNVAISPLRSSPSHKSEMVSQLLFGERCFVLEHGTEHWVKVRCRYDNYEGWCQESHLAMVDALIFDIPDKLLTKKWVDSIDYNRHSMRIPLGSNLSGLKKGQLEWNGSQIRTRAKTWKLGKTSFKKEQLLEQAFQYLNVPYLWGGRSVFGIDCSGFTQSVFKFFDVELLRDTYQQAEQGKEVAGLSSATTGDLAFFDNESGRIMHVGILLNDHEIIHASGKVRVDDITSEGIINRDTLEKTHQLKLIRRMI